jgi:hypothetical protein
MPERPPPPPGRFAGSLMIAFGLLIAGLCGTCTFQFIFTAFVPPAHTPSEELFTFPPVTATILGLVVGGIPTLLGLALIWGGVSLFRRHRERR